MIFGILILELDPRRCENRKSYEFFTGTIIDAVMLPDCMGCKPATYNYCRAYSNHYIMACFAQRIG